MRRFPIGSQTRDANASISLLAGDSAQAAREAAAAPSNGAIGGNSEDNSSAASWPMSFRSILSSVFLDKGPNLYRVPFRAQCYSPERRWCMNRCKRAR